MIERDGQGLHVRGAITLSNVTALCAAGKQQLADGDVVDLSGVTEVDSSALSLIFEWQREAKRRKLKISFSNHPASLTSLATLYGIAGPDHGEHVKGMAAHCERCGQSADRKNMKCVAAHY